MAVIDGGKRGRSFNSTGAAFLQLSGLLFYNGIGISNDLEDEYYKYYVNNLYDLNSNLNGPGLCCMGETKIKINNNTNINCSSKLNYALSNINLEKIITNPEFIKKYATQVSTSINISYPYSGAGIFINSCNEISTKNSTLKKTLYVIVDLFDHSLISANGVYSAYAENNYILIIEQFILKINDNDNNIITTSLYTNIKNSDNNYLYIMCQIFNITSYSLNWFIYDIHFDSISNKLISTNIIAHFQSTDKINGSLIPYPSNNINYPNHKWIQTKDNYHVISVYVHGYYSIPNDPNIYQIKYGNFVDNQFMQLLMQYNILISYNYADGYGGGLFISNVTYQLDSSLIPQYTLTLQYNFSKLGGGGIYINNYYSQINTNLHRNTINETVSTYNISHGNSGGSYIFDNYGPQISYSVFENNLCANNGGGLYLDGILLNDVYNVYNTEEEYLFNIYLSGINNLIKGGFGSPIYNEINGSYIFDETIANKYNTNYAYSNNYYNIHYDNSDLKWKLIDNYTNEFIASNAFNYIFENKQFYEIPSQNNWFLTETAQTKFNLKAELITVNTMSTIFYNTLYSLSHNIINNNKTSLNQNLNVEISAKIGGGIYVNIAPLCELTGNFIYNNYANYGAGLAIYTNTITANIRTCYFKGNQLIKGVNKEYGHDILIVGNPLININNCTFYDYDKTYSSFPKNVYYAYIECTYTSTLVPPSHDLDTLNNTYYYDTIIDLLSNITNDIKAQREFPNDYLWDVVFGLHKDQFTGTFATKYSAENIGITMTPYNNFNPIFNLGFYQFIISNSDNNLTCLLSNLRYVNIIGAYIYDSFNTINSEGKGLGGAISFQDINTVYLQNSTFYGCKAEESGGALYFNINNLTIDNCDFINNSCSGFTGGAIAINSEYIYTNKCINNLSSIVKADFINYTIMDYSNYYSNNSEYSLLPFVNIIGGHFNNNSVTGNRSRGGAIFVNSNINMFINPDSTYTTFFANNYAKGYGYVLFVGDNSTLDINNCYSYDIIPYGSLNISNIPTDIPQNIIDASPTKNGGVIFLEGSSSSDLHFFTNLKSIDIYKGTVYLNDFDPADVYNNYQTLSNKFDLYFDNFNTASSFINIKSYANIYNKDYKGDIFFQVYGLTYTEPFSLFPSTYYYKGSNNFFLRSRMSLFLNKGDSPMDCNICIIDLSTQPTTIQPGLYLLGDVTYHISDISIKHVNYVTPGSNNSSQLLSSMPENAGAGINYTSPNRNTKIFFNNIYLDQNIAEAGGGLLLTNSYPYSLECHLSGIIYISNNKATIFGGGIGIFGNSSNLNNLITIIPNNCELFFINNTAQLGGGITCSNTNFIFNLPSTTSNNLYIINNKAEYAGGFMSMGESNVTLNNGVFINNKSKILGGALYLNNSKAIINNCEFKGNSIESNNLTQIGGCIYLDSLSNIDIIDSSFINNKAYWGGAIFNDISDESNPNKQIRFTLKGNNIFKGNSNYGVFIVGPPNSMDPNIVDHNTYISLINMHGNIPSNYIVETVDVNFSNGILYNRFFPFPIKGDKDPTIANNKDEEFPYLFNWLNNTLHNYNITTFNNNININTYADSFNLKQKFTYTALNMPNTSSLYFYFNGIYNNNRSNYTFTDNTTCGFDFINSTTGSTNREFTFSNINFKGAFDNATFTSDTSAVTIINNNSLNSCTFTNINSSNFYSTFGGFLNYKNNDSNNNTITVTNLKAYDNYAQFGQIISADNNCHVSISNTEIINTNSKAQCIKGGAFYLNKSSTISISNSYINNVSANTGGLIYHYSNETTITSTYDLDIYNSTFHNIYSKYDGGYIYSNNGNINIVDSLFDNNLLPNNSIQKGDGGVVYATGNSNINILKGSIQNININGSGGCIYIDGEINVSQSITINNTTLMNIVGKNKGGAIYTNHANVYITNVQFNGNNITINEDYTDGPINGGFIYMTGTVTKGLFVNSNFNNIIAQNGGVFYINSTGHNMPYFEFNDIILENNIAKKGGNILINSAKLILNNTTITVVKYSIRCVAFYFASNCVIINS